MPEFRVNAKNFFLTYPKTDETSPKSLGEFLLGQRPVTGVLVVRERHADGTYHLHALVAYARKYDCKNERAFDFGEYHPNIQSARNVGDVYEYCIKHNPEGDDRFEFGNFAKKRTWADVIAATTSDDVFAIAKEIAPRDFVLQNDRIASYASSKRVKIDNYESPHVTFNVPDILEDWRNNELNVGKSFSCASWLRHSNALRALAADSVLTAGRRRKHGNASTNN